MTAFRGHDYGTIRRPRRPQRPHRRLAPRPRRNQSKYLAYLEGSNFQPSILVTHGEGIFRLILMSQAVFGVLTVFWWHMHYFETQDEKNGKALRHSGND